MPIYRVIQPKRSDRLSLDDMIEDDTVRHGFTDLQGADRIPYGARVVVNLSGGKDSLTTAIALEEAGIDVFGYIYADTGWEAAELYQYLETEMPRVLSRPIYCVRAEVSLDEWPERKAAAAEIESMLQIDYSAFVRSCLRKLSFPARSGRGKWCTYDLKVAPAMAAIGLFEEEHNADFVRAVGIRRAESRRRAAAPIWYSDERTGDRVWAPIADWSLDDVIALHNRHGIAPNPLYLKGADRVGCWLCVQAKKEEIRLVADTDPARIDAVRALESYVNTFAAARARERGKEHKPTGLIMAKRANEQGLFTRPIDERVQWSRTSRGGKELQLFPSWELEAPCKKWGWCEM